MSTTDPTPPEVHDEGRKAGSQLHVVEPAASHPTRAPYLLAFRSISAADMGCWTRLLLMVGAVAVVAGGVHIDQELMLPVIDRTMRVADGVAEVVSFLFASIAALSAWSVGKSLREVRAYGWGNPSFWLNVGGFALIGASFFGMRILADAGGAATSRGADPWAMAWLLLATYLAVGLLAAAESYYLVNPALSAKIRADRLLARLAPAVQGAEVKVVETSAALRTAVYREEAVHLEHGEAIAATHAVAAGARDYARILIAASLGDPAQTGLVGDRYQLDEAGSYTARPLPDSTTATADHEIEENR